MASMNSVFLMGNLTRDPELRYTPSQTAVVDLGLAVNERFRSRSGEQQERTLFVDVVAWDRQAETCEKYLSKGSPILVEGNLQLDRWENNQGEKRSKIRVRARRVQFLGSAQAGDRSAPATNQTPMRGTGSPDLAEDEGDEVPF